MFLIKTIVGPSKIHGNGVFALEPVSAGQTIWRFYPPFDQVFSDDQLLELPKVVQDFLDTYSYRSVDLGGKTVLSGDHAKFLNHSGDPNTEERPFFSVARTAIAAGEEITCDYDAFCTDGAGSAYTTGAPQAPAEGAPPAHVAPSHAPHQNLYTRLQRSADGIGVFAIRDIPAGTALFAGDSGATVRVPVRQVEQIEDDEIRRMYVDFCPIVEGAYVAPQNFNAITMGWYLNHSDDPNVIGDDSLRFVTSKFIAKGSELRSDYEAYSPQAGPHIKFWREGRH